MRPPVFQTHSRFLSAVSFRGISLLPAVLLLGTIACEARNPIRSAFFDFYPSAENSALDDLPSNAGHCGVCHYSFDGGGARNPYGVSLEAVAQANGLDVGRKSDRPTIVSLADGLDPDGDGFTTSEEMDTTGPYINTPTFPGLSITYLGNTSNVTQTEVQPYLFPLTSIDTDPPSVTATAPNGGETVTANQSTTVTWTASDPSGITAIHIYLSLDNGATFRPVELGLEDTGSYSWIPANRPSTTALIQVVAVDGAGNPNDDASDAAFTIVSPAGGRVPTTLRDFDMPGSQPFEGGLETQEPEYCASCHGNYDPAVEPYANWSGSMMAQAGIDPLFLANMAIANQDAPESGDLCLRCHNSRGWLQGRSVPTDGSRMKEEDQRGVSCDFCHRMVDPVYQAGVSPPGDVDILAALSFPGTEYGNGMLVIDTDGNQRGPFANADAPHAFIESPFHTTSAFCGTCHDVSNPAFTKDGDGIYQPNAFDTTNDNFSPHSMAPVERTYSEWLNSEYAATGVYQPEFAGNKADGIVSSCQDCHMHDVDGVGCNVQGAPTRGDLPLHDMTGGSTWIAGLLPALHPTQVDVTSGELVVRVTNQTGHKLPTGYPEGRRIWVNVQYYDDGDSLISESGAYDSSTGVLTHDPEAKIYEVHPGIGDNIDEVVSLPVGPSLHFVLNNQIFEDNRIPPRGFTNAAFDAFGGTPVGHPYADGQHWDDTPYTIPPGTVRAELKLYYQSTSKEFIEFLRDENTTDTKGQEMYDLWVNNSRCPPELMAETTWTAPSITFAGLESASPGIESATLNWSVATSSNTVIYSVYHSITSGSQNFGSPPLLTTQNLSIEISPLDPGSTSQLTHYFVVRATDDGGGSESNTVERSVQPLLDPVRDQDGDGMTNSYETAHSLNPFDATDALQDPDNDGLTTLEECAFGSDPNDASSANRPQPAQVDVGGTLHFALSYIRAQAPGTPTITPEISGDLMTWNSGPAHTTEFSVTDNLDGNDTVVVRMVAPMAASPRDFMRLRVTAN